ncbi:MAG: hypothetical protein ACOC9Z_07835 [Chloroflexota bacterium]
MIDVTTDGDSVSVVAGSYRLITATDRPFVRVFDAGGDLLCELFVPSSINPLHDRDDTVALGRWHVEAGRGPNGEEGVVLCMEAQSSVWEGKEYRFHCSENSFQYEVTVSGSGCLAEANFFGGYYSADLRWGSGFFPSGQRFLRMFNPEPDISEEIYFLPAANNAIDLMGVPLPSRGDWFFTPAPFAFSCAGANGWMAMGVAARPGTQHFTALRYHGQRDSFFLTLDFEGYTPVSGSYTLPAIRFDFAADDGVPAADAYEALAAHVEGLRAAGLTPQAGAEEAPAWWRSPQWWRSPIFCGWGAQCHLAKKNGAHAPDYARQALYEQFLAALEEEGIAPGTIVVDDKWQATYGNNDVDETKWPSMKAFVAEQHEAGRRVLLWLKAWDPEGVPAAECMTNAAGAAIAVDPTNPAYERRLRAAVRHLLSPEGLDADGFKIDFTARIPSGPGIRRHGEAWGLELMKQYLGNLYDEAKRAKADALIMTHTPHPYLADVLDMIRLNDMNIGTDIPRAMKHRARVARIACPEAIVDTDNWPIADKATWRAYVPLQAELGVPSLYYSSHVDATGEPLEAEDYELLREVWQAYRERVFATN